MKKSTNWNGKTTVTPKQITALYERGIITMGEEVCSKCGSYLGTGRSHYLDADGNWTCGTCDEKEWRASIQKKSTENVTTVADAVEREICQSCGKSLPLGRLTYRIQQKQFGTEFVAELNTGAAAIRRPKTRYCKACAERKAAERNAK